MRYEEAVAEAASALTRGEDANWELARLTYENTKAHGGPNDRVGVTLAQWSADVEEVSGRAFSVTTAGRYRRMWEASGKIAHGQSWAEAYERERGGTPDERMADFNLRRAAEHEGQIKPETKIEVAAKLLSDPQVADAVIEQPEARRAVYESLGRREQRTDERRKRTADADPDYSQLRGLNAVIEMDRLLGRFTQEFVETFRLMAALPADDPFANREFLTLRLSHAQECLDQLRTYLETGKTDLDSFLDSVLKGRS